MLNENCCGARRQPLALAAAFPMDALEQGTDAVEGA